MAYQQVTLAQFRTSIQLRWESTPFWTDDDIKDAINEGLRIWNLLTGFWKIQVNVTTVANQVWYATPATVLYPLQLYHANSPMTRTSIDDLDYGKPNWEADTTASGTPVPTRPKMWAPKGLELIAIWPADAANNNTMQLNGIATTPTLSADGDFIDIGQEEQGILEGYALHAASLKVGGTIWKATFPFYRDFIEAAGTRNELLRAQSFYRELMGLDMSRFSNPAKFPSTTTQQILQNLAGAS